MTAAHRRDSNADEKRLQRALKKREQDELEHSQAGQEYSMWELHYTFQGPVGLIRILEDWTGEGNGIAGLQWLGGVMLSRYMDSREAFPEDYFRGKRIIELGAGCGLTGIYASLRGARVILTDMDTGKCAENVETNCASREPRPDIHIEHLEWGNTDLSRFYPPFDLILAGDCLYEEACIRPLLTTMRDLSGPHTEILLCGIVGENIQELFWGMLDQYFTCSVVDTGGLGLSAPTLLDGPAQNAHGLPMQTNPGCDSEEPAQCTPVGISVASSKSSGAMLSQCGGVDSGSARPGLRAMLRLSLRQQ